MKRNTVVVFLTLSLLLTAILTGCPKPQTELEKVMTEYSQIMDPPLPTDFRLTIYYISPKIYTFIPVSTEELISRDDVQKFIVEQEELALHTELLKKLDASILHPVKEESYIDARLYYIFETGDSGKILEVVISQIHGSAFVNGIEVEDNPIFYEIIDPFLTEEDRNILGY